MRKLYIVFFLAWFIPCLVLAGGPPTPPGSGSGDMLSTNNLSDVADAPTALSNLGAAAALGADDNYVTDAEKTVIGNTSGANTGDQVVADEVADTTCFPIFATAQTAVSALKTNAGLYFNSATGLLGATGFKMAAGAGAGYVMVSDADGNFAWSATLSLSALDMGAGTFEIPNGTDPDLTVTGQISQDTDGANVTGDVSIRGFDGTNQFMVARKLKTIQVTVVKPQDMADAVRDAFLVWSNETGMTFTITNIKAWSGTDDTTLNVETTAADGQTNATVDAVEIATNGTGVFTSDDSTITAGTIAAGSLIWLDFDDTDDPAWVKLSITGWFNANVD